MSKAGPTAYHPQLPFHPQPSLHSTIVDLRLNENKIRSVHYSSLSRFGNLTYLNLTKNDISYVEDGAFSAQFNLQVSADPGDANIWIFPRSHPAWREVVSLHGWTRWSHRCSQTAPQILINCNQRRDVFCLCWSERCEVFQLGRTSSSRSLRLLEAEQQSVFLFPPNRAGCCRNELACLHGYRGGWSPSRD